MKLTVTIWNTDPAEGNKYFHASDGDDKTVMLEHGWTYVSTYEIEFEPGKPDVSTCIEFLEKKIQETMALSHIACKHLREKIRNLQALTYEETNQ